MAGRVSFIDEKGNNRNNAGKGSCLVIYGQDNLKRIEKMKGVLVRA